MRIHAKLTIVSALVLCLGGALTVGTAWGATAHDESVDGDLSTDPANPTPVSFFQGSNEVFGTVQSPGDTRDYLTFTIGPGKALSELLLLDYTDVASGGGGDTGFTAINAGATSEVPSGTNSDSFLGGNHLDPSQVGTDILPGLAAATLSGTGFTIPLGPGTYSYLVQQTGTEHTAYGLDFVIIPEPTTLLLTCLSILAIGTRRRRA